MNDTFYDMFSLDESKITITSEDATRSFGDIYDLANAFLSIEAMTHKKLQKLCYYAKAWYLAINDENLIEEQFEAWIHGAVQPALYQEYRSHGFQLIPMFSDSIETLPEEFLSFSREVFQAYGDLSGDDLERLNHQEEPWVNARRGLQPWQSSNTVISEEDMKVYYRGLMENGQ